MPQKRHPSITEERIIEAAELSMFGDEYPGFCLDCGADADCCEPDAEGYRCDECGANAVLGAEQLMFTLS